MARRRQKGRSFKFHKKAGRKDHSNNRMAKGGRLPSVWIKARGNKISDDDVIGFIATQGGKVSLSSIVTNFELGRSHRKALATMLSELCDRTILSQEENQYILLANDLFFHALLSVNPRGFAFAALTPVPKGWAFQEEAFINPSHLGSAIQGDQVLIKIIGHRGDRAEAKVIAVLNRKLTSVVGIFHQSHPFGIVTPEDERYPFTIRITESFAEVQDGDAVVALLSENEPGKLSRPKGTIIELLGNPDSLKVQTEIVIRKFELPHRFSQHTAQQIAALPETIEKTEERTDLRHIFHFTIDGETARDFDDAVAITKKEKGSTLYVSIADVSHYVPLGSPLDTEAYTRGTSVYFPTRVLPMLPEKLSNNLCSLVPNKDRYAFTAILDFDANGILQSKKFTKSIIKSLYRMTYTKVSKILIDKEPLIRKEYKPLIAPLEQMEKLARLLLKQRMSRGSIGFELPEAFIEITENDEVQNIARQERNFAHQIIEEFMLAANEAVAKTMADHKLLNGLYRIHEQPDKTKVSEFKNFAHTMGLKLPKGNGDPLWFGEVLKLVAGQPQEYIVNNLLLRTMKQARYSIENTGHFGLAAKHYCHFTSPIRRYPDLMVHRTLAHHLQRQKEKTNTHDPIPADAGEFLSKRERIAVDAEREMVDRLKVRYMEDKVGETFSGIISGVTSFGLFVELLDSFVSGAIPITALTDDYYTVDEKNHRLIGSRSHKIYQVGNLVSIRLTSVEKERRRINFEFADS